jgi:predicted ATPase
MAPVRLIGGISSPSRDVDKGLPKRLIGHENQRRLHHQRCENGVVDWDEDDVTDQFELSYGGSKQGHRFIFPSEKLYGRELELATLERLYSDTMEVPHPTPASATSSIPISVHLTSAEPATLFASKVIVLSGYSGSGKTALANAFVKRIRSMRSIEPRRQTQLLPVIYCQGKYEEQLAPVPYKGISEAFERWFLELSVDEKESLFPIIKTGGETPRRQFGWKLQEMVGEDIEILVDILPKMGSFLLGKGDGCCSGVSSASDCSAQKKMTDGPINKVRLHFAFQSFLRCLCTSETPIVLFFDDLQWADPYSLELLLSILSASSIGRFFCILAARSNEVNGNHPLCNMLGELVLTRQIQTIRVDDLSRAAVSELIADTLSLDLQDVEPLSAAIYQRSLGNVLYTKQALDQLVRTNAMYFDMVEFRWNWILSEEKLESLLASDLVEMVKSKIETLPFELHQALVVAAHTRSSLDLETLLDILNAEGDVVYTNFIDNSQSMHEVYNGDKLCRLLDLAVEEGLLVKSSNEAQSSNSYQCEFVHDRIREAARSMVVGDELHSLLFKIGNVLARRGSNEQVGEEWMLFTSVHHLNSIPQSYHDVDGKLRLARLNLEAAKRSIGKAAFEDAEYYAEKGILLLPDDRWDVHGLFCHEMYCTAAEACRLCGNIQRMERLVTICLTAERDRPLESTYQVYYTLAKGLMYGSRDRHGEAKAILLNLLKHMDCTFPTSALRLKSKALVKIMGLKLAKKARTRKDPETMQFMTNPIKKGAMKLLDKLIDTCYLTNDGLLLVLVIFTGLDYTHKYGLNVHSPRFAASACIVLTGLLDDLRGGGLYAEYALRLMRKVNHRPIEAGTLVCAYSFGVPWTVHTRECLDPLKYGYEVGITTGDAENGKLCLALCLWFKFQAGTPLPIIESECRVHVPRIRETGQTLIWPLANGLWNVLRRLMGARGGDLDPVSPNDTETQMNCLTEIAVKSFARIEQCYIGEYEQCAESALRYKDTYQRFAPGAPVPPIDMALSAVACIEVARRTGKQEYLLEAKRLRKWIVNWARKGNPNLQHWKALLDAEFAVIHGREKVAIKKFQHAVDLANEGGYIHDAALANELWGTYLLEVTGDKQEAEIKVRTAVTQCIRWGALAKAQRIKERFPSFFHSNKRI